MMKFEIAKIEKLLDKKLQRNLKVLGLDCASRSGWASIQTTDKYLNIEYGFIDISKTKNQDFKYKILIEELGKLVKGHDRVVIEDVFFGANVSVLKLLARIGMIAYVLADKEGIKDKYWILASQIRTSLGFKGTSKKEVFQEEFIDRLDLQSLEQDQDIVDAIAVALHGLLVKETANA